MGDTQKNPVLFNKCISISLSWAGRPLQTGNNVLLKVQFLLLLVALKDSGFVDFNLADT
jgi:hypothetical protein